jgi:uroporphyrinogen decarboxylase
MKMDRKAMGSRERVLAALAHREPDRVPRDLGGSRVTSIHVRAYRALRPALGLPEREPVVGDLSQQLAVVEDDVVEALGVDVRGIGPKGPSGWRQEPVVEGALESFRDEWGVVRSRPVPDGLYFDMTASPLAGDVGEAEVAAHRWPDPADPGRYVGMAEAARRARADGRAVYLGSISAGITETFFRLRGYEDGYMDLAAQPDLAARIMRRVLDVKLGYWERALAEVGDDVDVLGEADDLGGQIAPLFSPETYRALVKPLHAELFAFMRARSRGRIFFHSCGAIRPLIPDLIEVGVDILNPVQVSAPGMDSAELKREYGRDLVFWGGAVDTQGVLGKASADVVRDEVRRRVEDLMPGGGFVFASVHNVQANVPPEHVLAMWQALEEAGRYA